MTDVFVDCFAYSLGERKLHVRESAGDGDCCRRRTIWSRPGFGGTTSASPPPAPTTWRRR